MNKISRVKRNTVLAILMTAVVFTAFFSIEEHAYGATLTRNQAYAAYLAKHPYKDYTRYYPGMYTSTKYHVNEYSIADIDGNGRKELITFTHRNVRYLIVRIFKYENGKVVPYKFTSGKKAVFTLSAEAAGHYEFKLCKKKHIHVLWSLQSYASFNKDNNYNETIYRTKNKKLQEYLYREQDSLINRNIAQKLGKKISIYEYQQIRDDCKTFTPKFIKNTKSNRNKLRK